LRNSFFELRRIGTGEEPVRDLISRLFPGAKAGFALGELASLLNTAGLRLVPTGIDHNPQIVNQTAVALAITGSLEYGGWRAAITIESDDAICLANGVLGRNVDHAPRELSGAEEGALLFAVDTAGADWLAAGGQPFLVKGLLSDSRQIEDYLGGDPDWKVSARLVGKESHSNVELLFCDPVPVFQSKGPPVETMPVASKWPVDLRISIGWARITSDEAAYLMSGDLLIPDELSFPTGTDGGAVAELRCGQWVRYVQWLDSSRLEILSDDERRTAMDTNKIVNEEVCTTVQKGDEIVAAGLEVLVRVEVAQIRMTVEQVARLSPGRILRLDRDIGSQVQLRVGDKKIGVGKLVDNEGQLAVEITEGT
jgi:flagellar motor switch/type III secretory pathway protein FliN